MNSNPNPFSYSNLSSIQLNVRGIPSAFDIFENSCVVASPGCMACFDYLTGSIKAVIHYEQPQQVRKVKLLKCNAFTNIAALRGGVVSIFDQSNTLRPLVATNPQHAHRVNDFDWCSNHPNILALAADDGLVSLWDIRSSSVNKLVSDDRSLTAIKWLKNGTGHIFAACSSSKLFVYDARTVRSTLAEVEVSHGISDFVWCRTVEKGPTNEPSESCSSESSSSDGFTIAIESCSATNIEWWRVGGCAPPKLEFSFRTGSSGTQDEEYAQSPHPSHLLASPSGRGLILCCPASIATPSSAASSSTASSRAGAVSTQQAISIKLVGSPRYSSLVRKLD